jgi:hypothetical protein
MMIKKPKKKKGYSFSNVSIWEIYVKTILYIHYIYKHYIYLFLNDNVNYCALACLLFNNMLFLFIFMLKAKSTL